MVAVAVLGLAIGALAVDRLILSAGAGGSTGPSVALAGALLSMSEPAPAISHTYQDNPVPGGRDLPAQLEELARFQQLGLSVERDAFRIPESWMSELAPKEGPSAILTPAEAFAQNHHLEAVILAPDGGTAVINGRCLSINERVSGFRLTSVTQDSAVLEAGEQRVVLRLKSGRD